MIRNTVALLITILVAVPGCSTIMPLTPGIKRTVEELEQLERMLGSWHEAAGQQWTKEASNGSYESYLLTLKFDTPFLKSCLLSVCYA